jgi:hypothetical protein
MGDEKSKTKFVGKLVENANFSFLYDDIKMTHTRNYKC